MPQASPSVSSILAACGVFSISTLLLALSLQVADRVMAAEATELPTTRCRVRWFNSVDDFFMTRAACLLGDLPAVRFDFNIVLVTARSEEKRMPEPVRCLRRILADEACRRVTAIAARDSAVRRLEPAVELFPHDMAVGARRRLIG